MLKEFILNFTAVPELYAATMNFRSQYFSWQVRKINNKGALLVLLWNFIACTIMSYPSSTRRGDIFAIVGLFLCGLSLPVVAYLSDVHFGRYKVIFYSKWLSFVSLISINVMLLIQHYAGDSKAVAMVIDVLATIRSVGLLGIVANTMQFGIDQLVDATPTNITAYISWYVWTFYIASFFNALTQTCFYGDYNSSTSYILLPVLVAISLISDFLLKKWLIVEPISSNPFKLIYEVLKYAMKNKHPQRRSAFTYWEDKPYSRLDLGKAKYGGPFTTEQVENVKTFFRIIPIMILSCILSGQEYIISIAYKNTNIDDIHDKASLPNYFSNCFKETAFLFSKFEMMCVFIPILELIIYPIVLKVKCSYYSPQILHKLLLGAFLVLGSELVLLSLQTVSTLNQINTNQTCHFDPNDWELIEGKFHGKHMVLYVLQFITGLADYLLFTSTFEFVSAQGPYIMKGVLNGIVFFLASTSIALSYGISDVFQMLTKLSDRKCGIWYYLASVCCTGAVTGCLILIVKCYIHRKRDEVLSNDQMFAIDYFNKYLTNKRSTMNTTQ